MTEESRAITEKSVLWSLTPVSPVTPLNVIEITLPDGGWMVTAVGVDPPVGTVIVFAPEARVTICIDPGLAAFVTAELTCVPAASPVNTTLCDRVELVLIYIYYPYAQKS